MSPKDRTFISFLLTLDSLTEPERQHHLDAEETADLADLLVVAVRNYGEHTPATRSVALELHTRLCP